MGEDRRCKAAGTSVEDAATANLVPALVANELGLVPRTGLALQPVTFETSKFFPRPSFDRTCFVLLVRFVILRMATRSLIVRPPGTRPI